MIATGFLRLATPLLLVCLASGAQNTGSSAFSSGRLDTTNEHIARGLKPHHDTGASPTDPLHFRHRYHTTTSQGALLYFEYEAKRHAHVVMLVEADASGGCGAAPSCLACTACTVHHFDTESGEAVLELQIADADISRLHSANLTAGSIIAGEIGCSVGEFSATRLSVRERVAAPIVRPGPGSAVRLVLNTEPAAMHE